MLRLAVCLFAGAMLWAQTPAPATAKLDLTVRTKFGHQEPIAGVSVTWIGPDNENHSDVTGADGHLRLTGLVPGVYRIRGIEAVGYTSTAPYPLSAFYIPAGDTAVLAAAMIPDGGIAGTVVDEEGKPIPGAIVIAGAEPGLPPRDSVGTAATSAEGRYLISVHAAGLPSRWAVTAYLPIERARELGKGFEPASSGVLEVKPGVATSIDLRLHSSSTFHLRGRVLAKRKPQGRSFRSSTAVSTWEAASPRAPQSRTMALLTRRDSFRERIAWSSAPRKGTPTSSSQTP